MGSHVTVVQQLKNSFIRTECVFVSVTCAGPWTSWAWAGWADRTGSPLTDSKLKQTQSHEPQTLSQPQHFFSLTVWKTSPATVQRSALLTTSLFICWFTWVFKAERKWMCVWCMQTSCSLDQCKLTFAWLCWHTLAYQRSSLKLHWPAAPIQMTFSL